MSFKALLVPLLGIEDDDHAPQAALAIAQRFGACVRGLFVRPHSSEMVPIVGEGISPAIIDQLVKAAEAEWNRRRDTARTRFEAACKGAGAPLVEPSAGSASGADVTASWLEVSGAPDLQVPHYARLADLTVFAQADRERAPEQHGIIETTLMGAGRPVLLVPTGWSGDIGRRVAVAWNDTAESARALALAMPLLTVADQVHLLTAETSRTGFEASRELATYLDWNGIACERHQVGFDGRSVGAGLLATATAVGADLMVMGGYGRPRFAEMVLGGVTRHVLANPEIPVVLAH